jgi:hypothetical protein
MVLIFSLDYDIFYFLKRFKYLENKIVRRKEKKKKGKRKWLGE